MPDQGILALMSRKRPHVWRPAVMAACTGIGLLLAFTLTEAALWVAISTDPEYPVAGERATVRVQTYVIWGADCLDDPAAQVTPEEAHFQPIALDAMELRAFGPEHAESFSVKVMRREDDPTIWDGDVVFPAGGQWKLRMVVPSWPPGTPAECAGAEVEVTVLRSQGDVVPAPTEAPEPISTTTPGPIILPSLDANGTETGAGDGNTSLVAALALVTLVVVLSMGTILFVRARHPGS